MYAGNIPEIELKFKSGKKFEKKITCSGELKDLLLNFYDQDTIELTETMVVLYLNIRNRIIGWQKHSQGGLSSCILDIKLVMGIALKCNASGIIISHNHPSGDVNPSKEDEKITLRLRDACKTLDLTMLDHIIVSSDGNYYSFAEESTLNSIL